MTDYNYPGSYEQQTLYKTAIRERDDYTCQLCGRHPSFDVDHIIPYYTSHDNSEANLRVLCHSCNLISRRKRKGNSIPIDQYETYLREELAKC